MARIRTIKPEFFTSEDIVSLTPLARLLYVALWCEADREGRLAWKPRTFKLRYFPGDDCDIDDLAGELVATGLVRLYGESLAWIPRFAHHQHINPRESQSQLPPPITEPEQARVDDASARVDDATVTHREEGKGKEGGITRQNDATPAAIPLRLGKKSPTKTSLPSNFEVSDRVCSWAREKGHSQLNERLEHFIGYVKRSGKTYADWDEAFMSAIREDWARLNGKSSDTETPHPSQRGVIL